MASTKKISARLTVPFWVLEEWLGNIKVANATS